MFQTDEIVDLLEHFPLLSRLSRLEVETIAREGNERWASDGDQVLSQGQRANGCGLILAGQVSVRINGVERTRLGPGEVFGEISTLLDEPVTADVVALGRLRYLLLSSARFRTMVRANPAVAYPLLQAEARRIRSPQRWYAASSASSERPAANWTPNSWQGCPVQQQPDWPAPDVLEQVLDRLRAKPPLVFAGEARCLTAKLAEVAAGQAFLLQAGDCAESFVEFSADAIRDKLKVTLQMAAVLTHGSGMHVVKVGRIAGQFAKPRSSPTEMVDGRQIPSFRGDMVNGAAPSAEARRPDPWRMLDGYHQSVETLNLLRALTGGGYASLANVQSWNQDFVASSRQGQRYALIADEIHRSLLFMRGCGIDLDEVTLRQIDYWTSHEALLLPYEEALTRRDPTTGDWYDCSAHMLWVGERTRHLGEGHVEFLSGVGNPIGCKLGPTAAPEEVLQICERLNPHRLPGRLTLVTRMGAAKVRSALPPLLAAVRDAGQPVVWASDPMHGNTSTTATGRKTRHFDHILDEIDGFFTACASEGAWPGGVHVELTGDDVTECLGGADKLSEDDLDLRYTTACDPRLNARQSLDMAFLVAERLRALPRPPMVGPPLRI